MQILGNSPKSESPIKRGERILQSFASFRFLETVNQFKELCPPWDDVRSHLTARLSSCLLHELLNSPNGKFATAKMFGSCKLFKGESWNGNGISFLLSTSFSVARQRMLKTFNRGVSTSHFKVHGTGFHKYIMPSKSTLISIWLIWKCGPNLILRRIWRDYECFAWSSPSRVMWAAVQCCTK